MAEADERIAALGRRLQELRQRLGTAYWQDAEVKTVQDQLRYAVDSYAAWSDDKAPMHQRARRAARLQSEYAALLWPGHDEG